MENGGHEAVLPVVVVGEATEAGFDATEDNGHVGEEFLEDACIDNGGVLRTEVMATVGGIGVFGTKTFVGSVFIHHRVHRPRGNAKEKTGTAEFLEVAVVAMPVGLGNDGNLQPFRLQNTPNHSHAKGGMVHVGIGGEEDDIGLFPAEAFEFFFGSREEVHERVGLGYCYFFDMLQQNRSTRWAIGGGTIRGR